MPNSLEGLPRQTTLYLLAVNGANSKQDVNPHNEMLSHVYFMVSRLLFSHKVDAKDHSSI